MTIAVKDVKQAKPLPAPNSDFYQLADVLTADEKAIVKKARLLGALRAGTKEG